MANYVGFLRGGPMPEMSPAQAQQTLERYLAWSERSTAGGGGLSSRGTVIRGLEVTDGPYVEVSEVVGGFITIEASSQEEATKIFSDHPHLEFGSIEVRKIGDRGCED